MAVLPRTRSMVLLNTIAALDHSTATLAAKGATLNDD